jgi:hypothetical protein
MSEGLEQGRGVAYCVFTAIMKFLTEDLRSRTQNFAR